MIDHRFFQILPASNVAILSTRDAGFLLTTDDGTTLATVEGRVVDGKLQIVENSNEPV